MGSAQDRICYHDNSNAGRQQQLRSGLEKQHTRQQNQHDEHCAEGLIENQRKDQPEQHIEPHEAGFIFGDAKKTGRRQYGKDGINAKFQTVAHKDMGPETSGTGVVHEGRKVDAVEGPLQMWRHAHLPQRGQRIDEAREHQRQQQGPLSFGRG